MSPWTPSHGSRRSPRPATPPPDRPADVISDVRTAYDGAAYGAAPTKGDATRTATLKTYNGTSAVYLESSSTYDGYGRALATTDLTADVTVTVRGGAHPGRPHRRPDHHDRVHPDHRASRPQLR